MFPLTMAFVAQWSHFHLNLSNFYMAVAMVAPMGLIMLGVMRRMFPNRALNTGLAVGFVLLFAAGLWLGRTEAFVGDEQFLRAMIPHRAPQRRTTPVIRTIGPPGADRVPIADPTERRSWDRFSGSSAGPRFADQVVRPSASH